jgi:hypothetical protein
VHVLRNMVDAVRPGGLVLDLQVIRPNPRVETDGRLIGEVDGGPVFRKADAATAAIDALVRTGCLREEAVDDHDVRKHYSSGADLINDFVGKQRRLPDEAIATLRTLNQTCVLRERCRLRRLAVTTDRARP